MKLSEELAWRGFVNQTTISDLSLLDNGKLNFYFGVDPSVDSMQIGNLAAAMMVRRFIEHGHKAYLLVGGATSLIGDPDGKAQERETKSLEEITKNKAGIAAQYNKVFGGQKFEIVDNYDWFKGIGYLDFLREVGKNVSLTQMLGRDFIQSRIGEGGSGISYAEFSYSLIQGYDFLHLFREKDITLQVCGADQWGNSIAGVDLIRRIEGKEAHVYSTPLIVNKTTGAKFGKSEDGAVWLDENKTSVYKFYQFWLNIDDESVVDLLKVYTLFDKEEIEALGESVKSNPGLRGAQKALASEVTKLVHGEDRLESVEKVTRVLFSGDDFDGLSESDIEVLSNEIPVVNSGKSVTACLVEAGVVASNSEAGRLIESGAVSVNGNKIESHKILNGRALIKKGKNSFVLVR